MVDKSIFEEAEIVEEQPEDGEDSPVEEEKLGEWKPTISKESPKARLERKGTKAETDGRTLTVKEIFFTRPKMQDFDGTKVEPKTSIDGKYKYYTAKLGVKFVEENLVEYYPNMKYFVNEKGQVSNFAKINRSGNSAVTALFKLVIAKMGKVEDEISDQEVIDFLTGKKVKTTTVKGTFKGKNWFRNDIKEIL